MMNILFLTPGESGKNLGGVERHVKLLTEELGRRGHEVKELSLPETDKNYKDYKGYKGGFNKGPALPRRGRALEYKLRAWGYLWRKRDLFRWAEVVHVHDVFWWVMPFIPIIKWDKSYKNYNISGRLFVTFHGWEGRWPPTRSAVWQKKLAAWLSDGTIGVGDFYQKWYEVKTDKTVWGVLDNSYKSYKDYKRGFNKGIKGIYRKLEDFKGDGGKVFRLAFFGRLEEVNGIEIALKAMNKGYKNYKSYNNQGIKIIFVGDGSWRKEAEKVGKVTGMIKNPWKYLGGADVVIASSYLAILEAAAMGKPVIAIANNPLKRDYLEGHPMRRGFEVVGSSDELAEIITNKNYKGYKGYKNNLSKTRAWARGQTAGKLAGEYEELWKLK